MCGVGAGLAGGTRADWLWGVGVEVAGAVTVVVVDCGGVAGRVAAAGYKSFTRVVPRRNL